MFAIRMLLKGKTFLQLKQKAYASTKKKFNISKWFFESHLVLTNSITSGFFMVVGDLIAQEYEYQNKFINVRYDWRRLERMFVVGNALGVLHHYYYVYLDKLLPKNNLKIVLLKVFGDQVVAAPLTIICFYYVLGLLEGKTIDQCTQEFLKKFYIVYVGDCIYWPPVQIINFYFLPTHLRVLYINLAAMIYNIFLSLTKYYIQE